ncbi:uncharacterized protein LOC117928763 [Vitis riparia]|uniref:uncharacterized protein LOC117928763 n=1 Tax=Vitis riparia TaxID=96939 RepID=UPI00155ADB89|nr:uncharacterized protein LOC117928763 [Vitis riparia]
MLMSLPSKVCLHQLKLLSHHQGFNPSIPRVPTFHKLNYFSQFHHHHRHLRFCSINGHAGASGMSNGHDYSANHEDSSAKGENGEGELHTSKDLLKKLKRYGISGILSYGLLNTAYYLTTFLLVWFYIAPAPGRMGYLAAVERFVKIMAMVWAGSQVTKLVRAGGALALAPIVDRGLSWFTLKFKFESQGKAFTAIVGFCFGLALILFFIVTLLWA